MMLRPVLRGQCAADGEVLLEGRSRSAGNSGANDRLRQGHQVARCVLAAQEGVPPALCSQAHRGHIVRRVLQRWLGPCSEGSERRVFLVLGRPPPVVAGGHTGERATTHGPIVESFLVDVVLRRLPRRGPDPVRMACCAGQAVLQDGPQGQGHAVDFAHCDIHEVVPPGGVLHLQGVLLHAHCCRRPRRRPERARPGVGGGATTTDQSIARRLGRVALSIVGFLSFVWSLLGESGRAVMIQIQFGTGRATKMQKMSPNKPKAKTRSCCPRRTDLSRP